MHGTVSSAFCKADRHIHGIHISARYVRVMSVPGPASDPKEVSDRGSGRHIVMTGIVFSVIPRPSYRFHKG